MPYGAGLIIQNIYIAAPLVFQALHCICIMLSSFLQHPCMVGDLLSPYCRWDAEGERERESETCQRPLQ